MRQGVRGQGQSGRKSTRKVKCASLNTAFLWQMRVEGNARSDVRTGEGTECSRQALSCLGVPLFSCPANPVRHFVRHFTSLLSPVRRFISLLNSVRHFIPKPGPSYFISLLKPRHFISLLNPVRHFMFLLKPGPSFHFLVSPVGHFVSPSTRFLYFHSM